MKDRKRKTEKNDWKKIEVAIIGRDQKRGKEEMGIMNGRQKRVKVQVAIIGREEKRGKEITRRNQKRGRSGSYRE